MITKAELREIFFSDGQTYHAATAEKTKRLAASCIQNIEIPFILVIAPLGYLPHIRGDPSPECIAPGHPFRWFPTEGPIQQRQDRDWPSSSQGTRGFRAPPPGSLKSLGSNAAAKAAQEQEQEQAATAWAACLITTPSLRAVGWRSSGRARSRARRRRGGSRICRPGRGRRSLWFRRAGCIRSDRRMRRSRPRPG